MEKPKEDVLERENAELRTTLEAKCFDNAQLRAELDALKAKVRELDAWLLKDRIMIAGEADNQTDAYAAMRRALSAKLRELGLITEARDAGKG